MSWLKSLFGKSSTKADKNDKNIEETTPTRAKEEPSYEKFQAMEKLGHRALAAKQYEKAIESYEKALQYFNIPNHPKYLSVLESIKKAKIQLKRQSGDVQRKSYVADGIIKPHIIYVRLYSSKQIPVEVLDDMLTRSIAASTELNPPLKEICEMADKNAKIDFTYEYVPYSGNEFNNVVENHSQTFTESLIDSPNPKLCRFFSCDVDFEVHDQQAHGTVLVVVFGDELA